MAVPLTDLEEVLPTANDSIYGLSAAVGPCDVGKAHRMAALLHAASVWLNCDNVSTRRYLSAAISNLDGAVKWATMRWNFILK